VWVNFVPKVIGMVMGLQYYKKYCIMQLYATNCYLQLCFVNFTTSHHHFQSINFLVTMECLIYNY
jgi:hypothetical protein